VSIKDTFLIYRSKRKPAKILEFPPPEQWQVIADFFRNNCEIMSHNDWKGEKDKENEVISLTTAQINMKKRKERISTIPAYVLEMSKKYNLSSSEMLDLESLIKYHFSIRTFKETDIIHGPNGNIKEISVVEFDEAKRVFKVTREVKTVREAKEHYIPTIDYLFGLISIKKIEKKLSFDDEMKRQLRLIYGITGTLGGTESVAPSIADQSKLADVDGDDE